jgi:hypothetical protein
MGKAAELVGSCLRLPGECSRSWQAALPVGRLLGLHARHWWSQIVAVEAGWLVTSTTNHSLFPVIPICMKVDWIMTTLPLITSVVMSVHYHGNVFNKTLLCDRHVPNITHVGGSHSLLQGLLYPNWIMTTTSKILCSSFYTDRLNIRESNNVEFCLSVSELYELPVTWIKGNQECGFLLHLPSQPMWFLFLPIPSKVIMVIYSFFMFCLFYCYNITLQ